MPEPTTSGSERTALTPASHPAIDPVSDDEAARVADELLGPPVASHVTRAYCRDAEVTP